MIVDNSIESNVILFSLFAFGSTIFFKRFFLLVLHDFNSESALNNHSILRLDFASNTESHKVALSIFFVLLSVLVLWWQNVE